MAARRMAEMELDQNKKMESESDCYNSTWPAHSSHPIIKQARPTTSSAKADSRAVTADFIFLTILCIRRINKGMDRRMLLGRRMVERAKKAREISNDAAFIKGMSPTMS